MFKFFSSHLVVFMSIMSVIAQQQNTTCPILPNPVTYVKSNIGSQSGTLSINDTLFFSAKELTPNVKSQLIYFGGLVKGLTLIESERNASIAFKKQVNVIPDSYSINIADKITIQYANDAACFYAVQSLMQLIHINNGEKTLNKGFVADYPNYKWRGLHLDVSRHFFSKEEVKRFLDLMAIYKFNVFHWHLTDDQGWRIESKRYPKLTEIGAWRDSTVKDHYSTKPRTYDITKYGGFYTQEDVKEIVHYAADRFITVVPEIEMPGHARAALAAYPNFSCTENALPVESLWGVFDDIFCAKKETLDFLKDLLDEFIPLFPGTYFHVGGDEAPKTRWKKCSKCQKVITDNKLKDEHELQSYFIRQLDEFLTSKGKKLIGWDEILEGGLSSNAAVMSWRGFEGGIEASRQGHEVVMTPGSHCYFDHYQGKTKEEPLAIGGYTPLSKVYEFSPISPNMSATQASFVLGGQANLWTEYIDSFDKLMYMAYPRAIALSQTLWNPAKKPSFETFEQLLIENHYPILDELKINFSRSNLLPQQHWSSHKQGLKVNFSSKKENDLFHLTISQSSDSGKKFTKEIMLQNKQDLIIDRELDSPELLVNVHTEHYGFEQQINIMPHKALGETVHFLTAPNKQYDSGTLTLVNGQKGGRPWKGHEWVGFDTSTVALHITLQKKRRIKEVDISFLNEPGSWIYSPKKIQLLNRDGRKKLNKTVSNENGQERIKIEVNRKVKNIYLYISNWEEIPEGNPGAGHVPWTFIDEIFLR